MPRPASSRGRSLIAGTPSTIEDSGDRPGAPPSRTPPGVLLPTVSRAYRSTSVPSTEGRPPTCSFLPLPPPTRRPVYSLPCSASLDRHKPPCLPRSVFRSRVLRTEPCARSQRPASALPVPPVSQAPRCGVAEYDRCTPGRLGRIDRAVERSDLADCVSFGRAAALLATECLDAAEAPPFCDLFCFTFLPSREAVPPSPGQRSHGVYAGPSSLRGDAPRERCEVMAAAARTPGRFLGNGH